MKDPFDYMKFRLPLFGHYEEVLKRGTPISGGARRFIVNAVYQECMKLACYPSRHLYRKAADLLVEKFPHLRDPTTLKGNTGVESWVECLKAKFKNMRKKITGNDDVDAIRRKHTSTKRGLDSSSRKVSRLTEQECLNVPGETALSQENHNAWLMIHGSEDARFRDRLLATAKARHEKIISSSLTESLHMFSYLATEGAMLMEFEILWKTNLPDAFQLGFLKLTSVITKYGDEAEVIKMSEELTGDGGSGDGSLAILKCIMHRCNERISVFLTEDAPLLTPCLMSDASGMKLCADGRPCFEVSSLLAGISCLFAAYWVFHNHYPKQGTRTLTFLEHAFTGLCETKPGVKCVELLSFFKRYSKEF